MHKKHEERDTYWPMVPRIRAYKRKTAAKSCGLLPSEGISNTTPMTSQSVLGLKFKLRLRLTLLSFHKKTQQLYFGNKLSLLGSRLTAMVFKKCLFEL